MPEHCKKHETIEQGLDAGCPACRQERSLCRSCGFTPETGAEFGCLSCCDAIGELPMYEYIDLRRPFHKQLVGRMAGWYLESRFLDREGLAQLFVDLPEGEDLLFDRFREEALLPQELLDGVADGSVTLIYGAYYRNKTPVHVVNLAGQVVIWRGSPTQLPISEMPAIADEYEYLTWEERIDGDTVGWVVSPVDDDAAPDFEHLERYLAPRLALDGYIVAIDNDPAEPEGSPDQLLVWLHFDGPSCATEKDEPDRFNLFPLAEYLAMVLTLIRRDGWRSLLDHHRTGLSTSEEAWNRLMENRRSSWTWHEPRKSAAHLDVLHFIGWIRTTDRVPGINPHLFANVRDACGSDTVDVVTCHMAALLVSPDVPVPAVFWQKGDTVEGSFHVLLSRPWDHDRRMWCVVMVQDGTAQLVQTSVDHRQRNAFPVGESVLCAGTVEYISHTDLKTPIAVVNDLQIK